MKEYTSKKRCPNCNGEPFKSTSPCTMCSGEGWIEIEGLRTDPYQQESATTSRACPANCPGNITRPTSQEAERMVDEIIGLAQSAEGHAHWGETKGSDECLKMMNEKKSRLLALQPISYKEACEFIRIHHRHHLPPQGWKFGIAVNDSEKVVGVITVGRPVSRNLDDGWTLEVTRCCTDGTPNAASKLYGAARRATFALGYKRIVTYTLIAEPGSSLTAAGWKVIGETKGGSWNRKPRPRYDKAPTCKKTVWECTP